VITHVVYGRFCTRGQWQLRGEKEEGLYCSQKMLILYCCKHKKRNQLQRSIFYDRPAGNRSLKLAEAEHTLELVEFNEAVVVLIDHLE